MTETWPRPREYPKERPPRHGPYLVFYDGPGLHTGWQKQLFEQDGRFPFDHYVTHWLPMPPAPEPPLVRGEALVDPGVDYVTEAGE